MKPVLSPPVKYFTDRSKGVLLLWIIYVISVVFLLYFPYMSNCEIATFLLVSWDRCGA